MPGASPSAGTAGQGGVSRVKTRECLCRCVCFCSPAGWNLHATNISVKTSAISRLNHWRTHHKRLTDLIIYLAISLCVGASILVATIEGVSENLLLESFFFFLITLLIFIHFIKRSRSFWRREGFWWLTSTLFLLHCGAWFFAFKTVGRPPQGLTFIAVWMIASVLEMRLFQFARNSILKPEDRRYLPE